MENINNLDLTGKQQHGFKKTKSTATAGILLQSIISRAADNDNFAIMASLDLSAAFDLINVDLLIKRLRLIGLPRDLINLVKTWLKEREFYVQVNGHSSRMFGSDTGTIQGSVLGPVLYAIYVSPLFDLTQITNFADDNFVVLWNRILSSLISNLEKELEMIVKWLKDSGLVVNRDKTEICLFHRNDQQNVTVIVSGAPVKSKKSMNVLGVTFDSKLNWKEQVANAIKKSNKSLYAIRMIKKYFSPTELKILLNTYYFSVLYYNSEIWLTPFLQSGPKQQLLSASANAIRSCMNCPSPYISFEMIHKQFKKSTPDQMAFYKISLLLYKVFNGKVSGKDWIDFNNQIISTGRQTYFDIHRSSTFKIGSNILSNKFSCINRKIHLDYLNLSFPTYKYRMKNIFLPYER